MQQTTHPNNPDDSSSSAARHPQQPAVQEASTASLPSAVSDPFYYRDYPLIYVNFKQMEGVRFSEPIAEWMSDFFGPKTAESVTPRLQQMEQHRNKLQYMSTTTHLNFIHDAFEKTYLPAAAAYINDLESLIMKTQGTPFEGGIPNLRFIWHHWLGSESFPNIDTNSLRVEVCCVIFNIAAAYSLMGCLLPSNLQSKSKVVSSMFYQETQEVLAYRCKMFKYAAIMFDELKKRLIKSSVAVDELTPTIADMLCSVMLAQAQACFYHIFKQPNPTPVLENQYTALALASSSYYLEFVKAYDVLRKIEPNPYSYVDDDEPIAPVDHMPVYWYLHCQTVRALIRATVLVHYCRFIVDQTDKIGYRVGYLGKACTILAEQIDFLKASKGLPEESKLLEILDFKFNVIHKMYDELKKDNETIYHVPVPKKPEIDNLQLRPDSRVAIGEKPDVKGNAHIASILSKPRDAFPSILSLASARAWLDYRQRRIECYMVHLNSIAKRDETLMTVLETHPEYLFLYFMYHRLLASVAKIPPQGLFQSKLGAEILLVKNPTAFSQISNLTEKILPELCGRAGRTMSRLQTEILELKNIDLSPEILEKRSKILIEEHVLCTKSPASVAIEAFSKSRDTYSMVLGAEGEKSLATRLFGTYRPILFDTPKVVNTSPSATPQKTSGWGFLWSVQEPIPNSPIVRLDQDPPRTEVHGDIPEHQRPDKLVELAYKDNPAVMIGRLVATLLDSHYLEREKIEDSLSSDFLTNLERKDAELTETDLSFVENWIEQEIQWLSEKSQKIYQHTDEERQCLQKLEEMDPGIDILTTHINTALKPLAQALKDAEEQHQKALAAASVPAGSKTSPPVSTPAAPTAATPDQDGSVPVASPVQVITKEEAQAMKDYSPGILWTLMRSIIRFKQAKRFASLCRHLEETVYVEAEAVTVQSSDILINARRTALASQNPRAKSPPERAPSVRGPSAQPVYRLPGSDNLYTNAKK